MENSINDFKLLNGVIRINYTLEGNNKDAIITAKTLDKFLSDLFDQSPVQVMEKVLPGTILYFQGKIDDIPSGWSLYGEDNYPAGPLGTITIIYKGNS